MKENDCIFCKIANGQIPSAAVFEDENFKVILDLGPASKGHALIIPKEHYANIFDMPDPLLQKAYTLAKKMAAQLKDTLECDGINILQNNGEAAGQTVFHFHIHLIPRRTKDHIGITWKPGTLTEQDKEEILSKFKA